jgi:DNA-binding PadR family transcriptional regulator
VGYVLKPLPSLQFAVLGVLGSRDLPGRDVRAQLNRLGVEKSRPAFYRLMARLEESGLIMGWYEHEVVNGQMLRERLYRATAEGRLARNRTADFHRAVMSSYAADGRSLA